MDDPLCTGTIAKWLIGFPLEISPINNLHWLASVVSIVDSKQVKFNWKIASVGVDRTCN